MTAPIAGLPGVAAGAAVRSPVLGKKDFLTLLVAQLRNQDPLSPMDGADFAAQLAQFSTVEQLLDIGARLDAQGVDVAQGVMVGQTQLAATLVGREVTLRGSELFSDGDTPGRVVLELPAGAGRLTIEVLDADGRSAGTQSFEILPSGRTLLVLDGMSLPEGRYSYRVTATGPGNQPVPVETFTLGRVDGMSFLNGQVALRIHGRLVPLLDIVEVLAAASVAEPVTPTEELTQP